MLFMCSLLYTGHDRHSGIGEEQQAIHSSNMMIATIMKRTEIELEAVQNEKSVYEQKCDKLEEKCDKLGEELEEVAKKKVDAEVKFEELEREVQRCECIHTESICSSWHILIVSAARHLYM